MAAKQQAQTVPNKNTQSGKDEKGASENRSYHVRAGERSGGGV